MVIVICALFFGESIYAFPLSPRLQNIHCHSGLRKISYVIRENDGSSLRKVIAPIHQKPQNAEILCLKRRKKKKICVKTKEKKGEEKNKI